MQQRVVTVRRGSSLGTLLGRLHIRLCWLLLLSRVVRALIALYWFKCLFKLILWLLWFKFELLKHLLVFCHSRLLFVLVVISRDWNLLTRCCRGKSVSAKFLDWIHQCSVRYPWPWYGVLVVYRDSIGSLDAHLSRNWRRRLLVCTRGNFCYLFYRWVWACTWLFFVQMIIWLVVYRLGRFLVLRALLEFRILVKSMLLIRRLLLQLRLGRPNIVRSWRFSRVRLISDFLEHLVDLCLTVSLAPTSLKPHQSSWRLLTLPRAEGLLVNHVLVNDILSRSSLGKRWGCIG